MTQEDKKLLLVDLCARLPYKTRVRYTYAFAGAVGINKYSDEGTLYYDKLQDFSLPNVGYERRRVVYILPYLRPLSSMTDEEKEELYHYYCKEISDNLNTPNLTWELRCCVSDSFGTDWLNAHHFDYRGLIPMGLALEAPEEMYKHFGDMDVVVTSVKHKNKL